MTTRAAPLPRPKPDIIEPAAPPERPARPAPPDTPPDRPQEIPGNPGGGDIDEPGRCPEETPARP